jgi:competence protein ComEC
MQQWTLLRVGLRPEAGVTAAGAARPRDALLPAVALFTAGALALLALPSIPPLPWLAGLCLPALLPWRWRGHYAMAVLGLLLAAYRAQGSLDSRWPLADRGRRRTDPGSRAQA